MLSPGHTPLPAAWAAGGSAWLDSALLPFVRVPCPLLASHSWAPQRGGSQRSCHGEGTQMLCVCPNPPKPTAFPWGGGFPPASSPCPTSEGEHNKACTPLTSTLAAASVFTLCFPSLGFCLLQGSLLHAHLSLPSCSPVSWASLSAGFPSSCPLSFLSYLGGLGQVP